MNEWYIDQLNQYWRNIQQDNRIHKGTFDDDYIKKAKYNLELLTEQNYGADLCYSSRIKECKTSFAKLQEKLYDYEHNLLADVRTIINTNKAEYPVIFYPTPKVDGKTWESIKDYSNYELEVQENYTTL